MTTTPSFPQSSCPSRAPTRARSGGALAATIALLLAAPAQPQSMAGDEQVARVLDAFGPYLSLGYTHDSNIYRLDDDAPRIGDSRADDYFTLAAGFDSQIEQAQQRFDINGEIWRSMFMEHDELDYTGSRANVIWRWQTSEAASGDLGFRHRRALRDFANQPTLDKVKDLRMENALFASGDFSLPGRLLAGLRGEFADISFSETERLDLERTKVGGHFGYGSSAGNWAGLDAEFVQGRYDRNPRADYDEYTIGPKVEWTFSARTSVEALVGYTDHDYDDDLREDYDGVTGYVEVTLADDGRNALDLRIYRDLSNLGDEVADFAVVDGIRVEPTFTVREGLDLRLVAGYEQREFDRDPDVDPLPVPADRDDDVFLAGAFVDWDVHRNVRLSAGADMEKRDSTRDLQDYDFARFRIEVTGHF